MDSSAMHYKNKSHKFNAIQQKYTDYTIYRKYCNYESLKMKNITEKVLGKWMQCSIKTTNHTNSMQFNRITHILLMHV